MLCGFQAFAFQRAHLELLGSLGDALATGDMGFASEIMLPIPKAVAEYVPHTLISGRGEAAAETFAALTGQQDMPAELADRLTANRLIPFNPSEGVGHNAWLREELGVQRRLVALLAATVAKAPGAFDDWSAQVPTDRIPPKFRRWRSRVPAN